MTHVLLWYDEETHVVLAICAGRDTMTCLDDQIIVGKNVAAGLAGVDDAFGGKLQPLRKFIGELLIAIAEFHLTTSYAATGVRCVSSQRSASTWLLFSTILSHISAWLTPSISTGLPEASRNGLQSPPFTR